MGSLSTGGGTSAVAASAHAGCERYRHTDPLVVGMSRRSIADKLGHPDTAAGIPEARWMRAMTFERLVRHEKFVSQLLTTAVGALGLARPAAVRRVDGRVSTARTGMLLGQAHLKAVHENMATMITGLAVPFVGLEGQSATPVKPDFAIVAPRIEGTGDSTTTVGSWLIMGDAKDYERVRSRIDDQRMLKGFLQVALGAESVEAWSLLPAGMIVHESGALAVPRNAFLQPEAVVERLDDHRSEVRTRVNERTALQAQLETTVIDDQALKGFVEHLAAEFDPSSCASCSLFNFCRSELRCSSDPVAVLIELGIRPELRSSLAGLIDGSGEVGNAPESVVAGLQATLNGLPEWTGQLRVDPAGLPGTINVVVAKSDAAALGVHGIGLQRIAADGAIQPWQFHTFADPQSPLTRSAVMDLMGQQIDAAMGEFVQKSPFAPDPVHLVMPDTATGDLLVSIADSLAGVETSRLRWQRDIDMGRDALTFDGEPAVVPAALTGTERLAVSFLLEEDRARAMTLRWPLIDLRAVLARHVVPGGAAFESGRLDYLVMWAEATTPLDHRLVSDEIADSRHTAGARLSNTQSDDIHNAGRGRLRRDGTSAGADPQRYASLVIEELTYKVGVVDRALAVLSGIPDSQLRKVHRALESDAQQVWRRRLHFHSSDLVRFGRTNWVWRNNQVDMLDDDASCRNKLTALGNPQAARDLALNAGTREIAFATVTSASPLRIEVRSRRIVDGSTVVALQINGQPCAEDPTTTLAVQIGSFKFGGLSLGKLTKDHETGTGAGLLWDCRIPPKVDVGDRLVVADMGWFGGGFKSGHQIAIDRPKADKTSAPKSDCHDGSFAFDPEAHKYCCRSHEHSEAEWSDELAERRKRGELNPQAWPPVIDDDQFDTTAAGSPTDATENDVVDGRPAEHLTIDDLD